MICFVWNEIECTLYRQMLRHTSRELPFPSPYPSSLHPMHQSDLFYSSLLMPHIPTTCLSSFRCPSLLLPLSLSSLLHPSQSLSLSSPVRRGQREETHGQTRNCQYQRFLLRRGKQRMLRYVLNCTYRYALIGVSNYDDLNLVL